MTDAVLDSSAVLALLLAEPGATKVSQVLPGALLSTVNLAEVITKLTERGMPREAASEAVRAIGATIVDFDLEQAIATGALRNETRRAGLSLGDRACLALAASRGKRAFTSDRAWVGADANVMMIR